MTELSCARGRRGAEGRAPPARQAGYTLMELMVTMAIAAMLLGMGAGVFLSLGKGTAAREAVADVSGLVMNARNASTRYPSALVVDPEENTIHAWTQKVVQELHFEARETAEGPVTAMGIDGRECTVAGGSVDPTGGRVGGGLRLDNGTVDCGNYAAYDVRDGLACEIWVKPERLQRSELVRKEGTFAIRLEASSRIAPRLVVRLTVQGEGGPDQVERAVTLPHAVRENEWLGVGVTYDRKALVMYTDQGWGPVVHDRWPETRRLMVDTRGSLLIGSGTFLGWIDDFRFAGVHWTEPLRMPQGVALQGPKKTIHFAGGRLDPHIHNAPESIEMRHGVGDGARITTIRIEPNGMLTLPEDKVIETGPAGERPGGGPPPSERKE